MATSLTARIALDILFEQVAAGDLIQPGGTPGRLNASNTLLAGTGTGQINAVFQNSSNIAASGTDSLDLAGGSLVDPLGVALTFTKLKAIAVKAYSTNNTANNVVVTRPASNGVPIFSAAGDSVPLHPGSLYLATWPGAGLTVTAGTGDLIDIVNSAGTNTVDYDIVLLGTA